MNRFLAVVTSFALLALAPGALADSPAQSFIQQRQAKVSGFLKGAAGAARDKQVAAVLDEMLDYDQLARRSLAKHWDEVDEAQRKEFSELLKQLVQRNYEKNIASIGEYDVQWLGEEPGTEGIVVHSSATSKAKPGEEPVTIDYRVRTEGAAFRVFDIITDGSSLVSNYKNQFHRVIQKDGMPALLKRMKDKLAKGGGSL